VNVMSLVIVGTTKACGRGKIERKTTAASQGSKRIQGTRGIREDKRRERAVGENEDKGRFVATMTHITTALWLNETTSQPKQPSRGAKRPNTHTHTRNLTLAARAVPLEHEADSHRTEYFPSAHPHQATTTTTENTVQKL
jgi:hypothetical protein